MAGFLYLQSLLTVNASMHKSFCKGLSLYICIIYLHCRYTKIYGCITNEITQEFLLDIIFAIKLVNEVLTSLLTRFSMSDVSLLTRFGDDSLERWTWRQSSL